MTRGIARVVVINDDSIESGGAAGIALASIRELRRRGIPVTLLTGDQGSNPEFGRLGVDVVSLGGRHILDGSRADAALRGIYSRKTAALMGAWIDANDTPATVYHLHNWHKVLSPSAFVPLRKIASRLVISAHDYFLVCPNGGYFHYPQGKTCNRAPMGGACLVAACDKRSYAHKLWRVARDGVRQLTFDLSNTPATVLAVHDGMRTLLERGRIAPHAIRVLRNPALPWRTTRIAAERNSRFLFVGRLDQDKGIVVLARAARRAGVRLKAIGTGPQAADLARDFPEIELTGWKPKAEIAALCRDARALVMPSQCRETFGLVAIEAAMSGIPIIASLSALITDEIVRLGVGVACQADEKNLAQAMATLQRDDVAVEAMSRRGFAHARQLAPTPDDWCEELISLYEDKLSVNDCSLTDMISSRGSVDQHFAAETVNCLPRSGGAPYGGHGLHEVGRAGFEPSKPGRATP
jgi:glycosyltransferase involved in cell wall biosynthesis